MPKFPVACVRNSWFCWNMCQLSSMARAPVAKCPCQKSVIFSSSGRADSIMRAIHHFLSSTSCWRSRAFAWFSLRSRRSTVASSRLRRAAVSSSRSSRVSGGISARSKSSGLTSLFGWVS